MNCTIYFRYLLPVLLLLCTGIARAQVEKASSPSVPLGSLLNGDGTLDLSTGYNGPLDASGWKMTTAPDGAPRFIPDQTGNRPPTRPGPQGSGHQQ